MNNKTDHEYTNEIVCPYCGLEKQDSWQYHDDNYDGYIGIIECGECGKMFHAERYIEITYITSKMEQVDDRN